jgi:hypothetical protein
MIDIRAMLMQLKDERSKLDQAIAALNNLVIERRFTNHSGGSLSLVPLVLREEHSLPQRRDGMGT